MLLAFPLLVISQNADVEGVKTRANNHFINKEFQQAKELYSQLVSLYPRDENYNYRFGACMLYVDSDKNYPLKFLEYAVSKPNVNVEAFYYLGLGYHYNYQFEKAILYFEKYIQKSTSQDGEKLPAQNQIRHCKNGRRLLSNIKNPRVLNVAKVSKADFFAAIKVRETGAKLLYAPSEFHSSVDKKKGYIPVMYSNKKLNVIFFSSYGKSEKTGLDLYMVRINDGDLTEPMKVSSVVNTSYDDAFAYLSNDGSTFFFASKGHNSMGGYDLFQCYFDSVNNSFTQPVNLDYVINTPDDDFMYAELPDEEIAYFASNRNSDKGKAFVYKVSLNSKPFQFAVVDGSFKSEKTKSVKITIQDINSKTELGSFSSDKKDGKYLLKLESGGKYNFLVEPYGSNIAYQGRVDIPKESTKKVLRQEIEIVSAEGQDDRLVIRNLFEELPQENDAVLLAQMYAQGAELSETPAPVITATNDEIVQAVAESSAELENELMELKAEAQLSLILANELKEDAQNSIDQAEKLAPEVSLNDISEEGKQKQLELNTLVAEAKQKVLRAESAFQLYEEYQKLTNSKQKDLDSQITMQTSAKDAALSGDRALLENIFDKQNTSIDSQKSLKEVLEAQEKKVVLKGKKAIMKANLSKEQQSSILAEINTLNAQKLATKKKKEKEAIQAQINQLKDEIPILQSEELKYLEESVKVDREHSVLKEKIAVLELIEDRKDLGLPTAVSTNVEIAALQTSIAETIKEVSLVEDEFVTDSKVGVSGMVNGSKVIENRDVEDSTINVAEQKKEGVSKIAMSNSENEVTKEDKPYKAPNTGKLVSTDSLAIFTSETKSNEFSSAINLEQSKEPDSNNGGRGSDSVNQIKQNETFGDSFAYTEEYEETVTNVIEVDGQSIPLDITSNTGKKRYSKEELSAEAVVLSDAVYNQKYIAQQNQIALKSNGIEKAQLNQQLQYNWIVDMEKERASLIYAAKETENSNYANQLNNKANDLEIEIANKRNFLALNARIIKQLEKSDTNSVNILVDENSIELNPQKDVANDADAIVNESNVSLISTEQEEVSNNTENLVNNEVGKESKLNPEKSTFAITQASPSLTEVVVGEVSQQKTSGNDQALTGSAVTTNIADASGDEMEGNSSKELVKENNLELISSEEQEEVTSSEKNLNTDTSQVNDLGSDVSLSQDLDGNTLASDDRTEENIRNEFDLSSDSTNDLGSENLIPLESAFDLVLIPMPTEFDLVKDEVSKESAMAADDVNREQSTLNELNNELQITKKKKDKQALEQEIKYQEYKLDLAEQEQKLLDQRSFGVASSQASVIMNPMGQLPSFIYAQQSDVLNNQLASSEEELDELQFILSETKKKKKRRSLINQIEDLQRRRDSIESLAIIASKTVTVIQQTEEHTLKTATPFGTQIMVELPSDSSRISIQEANKVKLSEAYVRYISDKAVAEKHIREAQVLNKAASEKMDEARELSLALEEFDLLMQITPEEDRPGLRAKIDSVRTEQQRIIKGANVYYTQAKAKQNEGFFILNMANKQLLDLPDTIQQKQIAAIVNNQIREDKSIASQDNLNVPVSITEDNVDEIPTVLNQQIFTEVQSSNYSETKPIPVDVKLPAGVVLKVQVGAFRNPISQETFKGFAPIVGERTPSGLTRYTAGLFTNFDDANNAKSAIRTKGYTDAFVVAYFNGERISIARARQLISGNKEVIVSNNSDQSKISSKPSVTSSNVKQETVTPIQSGDNISVSDVTQTNELFFTVQVGVYNSRVNPKSVFSISPLNVDVLKNGLIRYSAGKYASLTGALQARNVVRASGISDAFVTAYFNGERISIARAKELLASQKAITSSVNSDISDVSAGSQKNYYIRVGPFTQDIDVNQAAVLLEMNKYGIKIERNSNGTFYKIGNFNNENEANILKQELVSRGVLNPKIVESENN